MPMLNIRTNVALDKAAENTLLVEASRRVAKTLGKPEGYVMVACQTGCTMLFAGTDDPLAYLELKSIGLVESQSEGLSAMLAGLMNEVLDVSVERVYIEFAASARKMWGWKGATF